MRLQTDRYTPLAAPLNLGDLAVKHSGNRISGLCGDVPRSQPSNRAINRSALDISFSERCWIGKAVPQGFVRYRPSATVCGCDGVYHPIVSGAATGKS